VSERDFFRSVSQIPMQMEGGIREYFSNCLYTLYFIFHDAQSQVKIRHARATKATELKSREMWYARIVKHYHIGS
jgi:hypothetical protein